MNEKAKLTIELMALAFLVNEETDYCVFIRFSGHIDSMEIEVAASKENYLNKVLRAEFDTAYKEWRKTDQPLIANLKSRIAVLKQILKDGAIDYSELEYQECTARDYFF